MYMHSFVTVSMETYVSVVLCNFLTCVYLHNHHHDKLSYHHKVPSCVTFYSYIVIYLYHFTFSSAMWKIHILCIVFSICYCYYHTYCISCYNICIMILCCAFNFHLPNNVKYISLCLFVIYLLSLVKCLFISFIFYLDFFLFSYCWVLTILYIFKE